jgi:hypothetical protein
MIQSLSAHNWHRLARRAFGLAARRRAEASHYQKKEETNMTNTQPRLSRRALLLTILLLLTTTIAPAQSDRTRRVRFARGRTTAVIKDAVVRGTRDRYVLGARAGQTLTVHITSLEDNAVFDVIAPGRKTIGEESTDWTSELPRSGDYIIAVGGTRGNATYTLEVTIR